jgi:hypothetical protein
MQVVIPKAKLEEASPCRDYFLDSPDWNGEALVYANWEETVRRLLSTRKGTVQLNWLVDNGLVPMTSEEFVAARAAAHPMLKGTTK